MGPPSGFSEIRVRKVYGLSDGELRTVKDVLRELHREYRIQEHANGGTSANEMRAFRMEVLSDAMKDSRFPEQIKNAFERPGGAGNSARDALVWQLWQCQYHQSRSEKRSG